MQPNSRIVYKVLSKREGKLFSAFVVNFDKPDKEDELQEVVLKREYAVGQTTLPFPGTKLFAFSDLEQARNYKSNMWGNCVYRATAENAASSGWFSSFVKNRDELVSRFARMGGLATPSTGYLSSVMCDAITLLDEVGPEVQTAYKVVDGGSDGKYHPVMDEHLPADCRLTYEVGVTTKPTVGKLFVFKDLPTRQQVNGLTREGRVFKCEVTGLEEALEMYPIGAGFNEIPDWWKEGKHLTYKVQKPPTGTYFASSATLIEDVTNQIKEQDA